MRRTAGISVLVASVVGGLAMAVAAPPMYQVKAEITAPGGADLGQPTLTTALNTEASIEYARDDQKIRFTVLVNEATEDGCHPMRIELQRTTGQNVKQMKIKVKLCAGKTVDFDGTPVKGPSMKIALTRVGA